jgi:hypothetical protein
MPAGIRDSNQELAFLTARQHHEPSTQQSLFFNTLRVYSEKNYRLQDIQLSKIRPTPRFLRFVEARRARKTAASLVKVFFVLAVRLRPSGYGGTAFASRLLACQPKLTSLGIASNPRR